MVGAFVLAGCGGSRLNPRNWFGRSSELRRTQVEGPTEASNPLIPEREDTIFSRRREKEVYEGTLVDQVTALELKPTTDGAILRVEGLPLRQGAYDVRLVPDNPDAEPVEGVLGFELRAIQSDNTPQGSERSRRVMAGVAISKQTVERTSEVRVRGARNEQISRR
ncbi:hypothetical protein [Roseovarius sp. MBR-154]